jgi:hypothetical protein
VLALLACCGVRAAPLRPDSAAWGAEKCGDDDEAATTAARPQDDGDGVTVSRKQSGCRLRSVLGNLGGAWRTAAAQRRGPCSVAN